MQNVNLPAPESDGVVYVSQYRLRDWELAGLATLEWVERGNYDAGVSYVINGRRYRYGGLRVTPKAPGQKRRRSFFQSVLVPMEGPAR